MQRAGSPGDSIENGPVEADPPDPSEVDTVILVHGLWMPGVKLYYLGWRLQRRGFRVSYFHYRSMRGRIDESARALQVDVQGVPAGRVHLVGYSLGGVVVARMLEGFPSDRVSRVALLGCPLQGSAVAEFLAASVLGRLVLGRVAIEGIVQRRPVLTDHREVLVVAGSLPLGIGLALGLRRPHDGTVSIAETHLEGAQRVSVRGSHLSLVFTPRVADLISDFFVTRR